MTGRYRASGFVVARVLADTSESLSMWVSMALFSHGSAVFGRQQNRDELVPVGRTWLFGDACALTGLNLWQPAVDVGRRKTSNRLSS